MNHETILHWVIFAVIFAAFLAAPFVFNGADLQNTFLALTGVVVLLYTAETRGLHLEMVRQTEMGVQLIVVVEIREQWEGRIEVSDGENLVYKNIGRGPAMYIQSPEIEFEKLQGAGFVARFEGVDYLPAGQDTPRKVTWNAEFEEGTAGRTFDFIPHLKAIPVGTENYEVPFFYEDIGQQQYKSVFRMGKDGIRLLNHGKVPHAFTESWSALWNRISGRSPKK
jgi:hypothetical protein